MEAENSEMDALISASWVDRREAATKEKYPRESRLGAISRSRAGTSRKAEAIPKPQTGGAGGDPKEGEAGKGSGGGRNTGVGGRDERERSLSRPVAPGQCLTRLIREAQATGSHGRVASGSGAADDSDEAMTNEAMTYNDVFSPPRPKRKARQKWADSPLEDDGPDDGMGATGASDSNGGAGEDDHESLQVRVDDLRTEVCTSKYHLGAN